MSTLPIPHTKAADASVSVMPLSNPVRNDQFVSEFIQSSRFSAVKAGHFDPRLGASEFSISTERFSISVPAALPGR